MWRESCLNPLDLLPANVRVLHNLSLRVFARIRHPPPPPPCPPFFSFFPAVFQVLCDSELNILFSCRSAGATSAESSSSIWSLRLTWFSLPFLLMIYFAGRRGQTTPVCFPSAAAMILLAKTLRSFSETDRRMSDKVWQRKADSLVSNGRPCSVRSPKSARISSCTTLNAYVYGWLGIISERSDLSALKARCGELKWEWERQREGLSAGLHPFVSSHTGKHELAAQPSTHTLTCVDKSSVPSHSAVVFGWKPYWRFHCLRTQMMRSENVKQKWCNPRTRLLVMLLII